MKIAARTFGWTALLAAVLPGIARQWPWWWALPYATPADYLTTTPGILYATGSLLILLAFFAYATHRRLVLASLAVAMMALQWYTQALGWERLVAYLAVLCVGVFLVEAWRQNRTLFRQLRADGVNARKLFGQAFVLWSPLLLVIGLGFYGNTLLLRASERMVYDVTPIDRYCEVVLEGQNHEIPCSGLIEQAGAQDFIERPVAETLTLHIRDQFSEALRESLGQLDRMTGKVSEADWMEFSRALNALTILALPTQEDPAASAVRNDDTLKRLRAQLRRINEQIDQVNRALAPLTRNAWFGSLAKQSIENHPDYKAAISARSSVRRQIRDREDRLRAQARAAELAQADGPNIGLRRTLVRQLAHLTINPKEFIARADASDDIGSADLKLHLIRSLDRMESSALDAALRLLTTERNRPLAYGVLYTTPMCSTERQKPDVEDGSRQPTVVNQEPFPCFPIADGQQVTVRPLGLSASTHRSINRWQRDRERLLTDNFRQLLRGTYRSAAEVEAKSAELTDAVPDTIHLGRKSCHVVLRPGNCLTNFVKGEAEAIYEERIAAFDAGVNQLVRQQTGDAAASVEEQLLNTRARMYATLDTGTSILRSTVSGMQQTGHLTAVLLNVLLVFAILKSYLYVLATRIFDARSDFHIDLGDGTAAQGSYVSAPAIEIPRAFTVPLITRDILDNQQVSTAIAPWPLAAPLARILTGTYFGFNRGSHFELSDQSMSFSRANGHDVVDWRMLEGEEVVFHYRNFFGASENVQLKTTISLRLSTLLFGRFVFHSAVCTSGEGRLLLTSAGTVRDQTKTDSTTLQRLIAWNRHSRFRVTSQGTMRSVLLDGYAIVRLRDENGPQGLIVVEAIRQNRSKMLGSLRFIRNLLLPF